MHVVSSGQCRKLCLGIGLNISLKQCTTVLKMIMRAVYAGSQYTENELEEVFNPCINVLLFELVVFA